MTFKKLLLDESLFDDESSLNSPYEEDNVTSFVNYDDDFSEFDHSEDHTPKDDMVGPKSGSDTGITDIVITAINDEWEAIRSYNSLIETLKHELPNNPDYKAFIDILNEINSEENKHVGQLQELLQKLSPNAVYIDKGREEGRSQFNFSNGQLQVTSWEQHPREQSQTNFNEFDETCTLTDVDDNM